MAVVSAVVSALHVLFGALVTGSVVFVTWVALPMASTADLGPEVLRTVVDKLTTLSRASALVLLVTGGHMAGSRYTVETLVGTQRGLLVVAMLVLWLVLTALVEIGASRMEDGLDAGRIREPARAGGTVLRVASVVAVLVLVDAGLLASGGL